MSNIEQIHITDITSPLVDDRWVYAGSNLAKESDAIRKLNTTEAAYELTDPVQTSLGNLLEDRSSLLFPSEMPRNANDYIKQNGIYIGHVGNSVRYTHGLVAIGSCERFTGDGSKRQLMVAETLCPGLHAKVSQMAVALAIEVFDIGSDLDSVLHFSPKPKGNSNIWSLFSKRKITDEQKMIGKKIIVEMPDKSVNSAYGVLEPVQSYGQRIS